LTVAINPPPSFGANRSLQRAEKREKADVSDVCGFSGSNARTGKKSIKVTSNTSENKGNIYSHQKKECYAVKYIY